MGKRILMAAVTMLCVGQIGCDTKAKEGQTCAKPEDCAQGLTCLDFVCATPETVRAKVTTSASAMAPTASPPSGEPCEPVCEAYKKRTISCMDLITYQLPSWMAPEFRRLIRNETNQLDCTLDCPAWAPSEVQRIDSCNAKDTCEAFTDCISKGTSAGVRANAETKTREKDGATMVHVPPGPFYRGSPDGYGADDEHPGGAVDMSGYWIDRTEVTAGQYAKCVEDNGCDRAGTGAFCNFKSDGKERHPINCVTWFAADKYCKWAGATLPTEAQWEKAARGPGGRLLPWVGFLLSCDKLVYSDDVKGHACGQKGTWAVGSKPGGTSPYGAVDMAGNVWEWAADAYDPGLYATAGTKDPANPDTGMMGVMRGGGWGEDAWEGWRTANRFKFSRGNKTEGIGFRCAVAD
jgi:formylglycine-generating enzyme required for sulfatase activity